jgi:hypothetical protein
MAIKPCDLDTEAMSPEERLVMSLYFKKYRYNDIFFCLGRLNLKVNGEIVSRPNYISPIIERIIRKYSHGSDKCSQR